MFKVRGYYKKKRQQSVPIYTKNIQRVPKDNQKKKGATKNKTPLKRAQLGNKIYKNKKELKL